MVKISASVAVNPKHVMAVMFDVEKLQTKVVFMGMGSVLSDKTFDETVSLLNESSEGK